jgi:hypothetical protein
MPAGSLIGRLDRSWDVRDLLVRESTKNHEQVFVRFWPAFLYNFRSLFQGLGRVQCFFALLSKLIEIGLFLEYSPIDFVPTDCSADSVCSHWTKRPGSPALAFGRLWSG